jgi:hypothetical protein
MLHGSSVVPRRHDGHKTNRADVGTGVSQEVGMPAAIGPRIAAARWQGVFPTVTTAYAYPWEDIQLRA